jgi:hypothetical protein
LLPASSRNTVPFQESKATAVQRLTPFAAAPVAVKSSVLPEPLGLTRWTVLLVWVALLVP